MAAAYPTAGDFLGLEGSWLTWSKWAKVLKKGKKKQMAENFVLFYYGAASPAFQLEISSLALWVQRHSGGLEVHQCRVTLRSCLPKELAASKTNSKLLFYSIPRNILGSDYLRQLQLLLWVRVS